VEGGVNMAEKTGRKRIAILGGGVGAMTAAFELTEDPAWREKYDITLYQLGWRLGGKGASGRNRRKHDRIEEHGLHLWFGYYENAFNLIQRCYTALGRRPGQPLATWTEAFHKHSLFVLNELRDGHWSQWPLSPPENDEVPGDGKVPPFWELLDRLLGFLHQHFETTSPADIHAAVTAPSPHPGWLASLIGRLGSEVEHAASGSAGIQAARALAQRFAREAHAVESSEPVQALVDGVEHFYEKVRSAVAAKLDGAIEDEIKKFPNLHRLISMLELGFIALKGMIADDVAHKGFDQLDGLDLREWLASHGASPIALDADSLRTAYESIFAYEQGTYSLPNLAAGTALRGIMRLCLSYKGAFAWKMQAGMGDTIFAPLYSVLRARGVRFEFFSRVKELVPSADGTRIAKVLIGRQATVLGERYEPLYPVKDLPCWPSEPFYDQLKEGVEIERLFEKTGADLESYWTGWQDVGEQPLIDGQDFDELILGISRGALPMICPKLIDQRDDWRLMIKHVRAVQTQSFQIWSTKDAVALGWHSPPPGEQPTRPVFGGFAQPHNTVADMSHLIDRENWPKDKPPKALFYFCGPLSDPPAIPPDTDLEFPIREDRAVEVRSSEWTRTNMSFLYPKSRLRGYPSAFPDSFDFGIFYDADATPENADISALRSQFWRANVDPSERYVVSLKGSTQYRLKAGAPGYANLKLAGDWTHTGLNYGCVEAAVMSGMEASRAIAGYPKIIFGENYPLA